jgi:hypothetical protein
MKGAIKVGSEGSFEEDASGFEDGGLANSEGIFDVGPGAVETGSFAVGVNEGPAALSIDESKSSGQPVLALTTGDGVAHEIDTAAGFSAYGDGT